VLILCASVSLGFCVGGNSFGFHRGIGAIAINSDADVAFLLSVVRPLGYNSLQSTIDVNDPKTPGRLKQLHDAGFWIFDYHSAFPDQTEPKEDFQIRADGSVKTGWVCPRSQKRLEAMAAQMKASADVGSDGMFWDFITVESTEREACFCPKCLAAFSKAAGRDYTREQLVAALDDPKILALWRKVREESTTEAIHSLSDAAARISAARGRPFRLGGYVIPAHSELGMDTEAMYRYLDVGAPMIYQGNDKAPLGWMKPQAEAYMKYGGKARNIVCVDTGFWVDEPPSELIATCYDCLRAGTDGYALWPYQTVDGDDLRAVAGVNQLDDLVYAPLRAGDVDGASGGLRKMADLIAADVRKAALTGRADADPTIAALRGEAPAIVRDRKRAGSEEFAQVVYKALLLWSDARTVINHRDDRIIDLAPYKVTLLPHDGGLVIATPDWTLKQNGVAENIDEVFFADNPINAATGNASLGLLRERIIDWFDGWATNSRIKVRQDGPDTLTVTTSVESTTCRIARDLILRRGDPWMGVVLRITNLDTKPRTGRLWMWNGWGYPGYLEASGDPWTDDRHELTDDNVLIAEDEGHYFALAADEKMWKLGGMGNDGTAHAYYNLNLKPGESWSTWMSLTFGLGGQKELDARLKALRAARKVGLQ
jgi:hypothetical protein